MQGAFIAAAMTVRCEGKSGRDQQTRCSCSAALYPSPSMRAMFSSSAATMTEAAVGDSKVLRPAPQPLLPLFSSSHTAQASELKACFVHSWMSSDEVE